MLLSVGAGLLAAPLAMRSSLALAIYFLLCWVLPQVLKAVPGPISVGTWLGFFETTAATPVH